MEETSKITIVNDRGESIVGILEKKPTIDIHRAQPRLILITHGVLGHKDYLFQRLMAQELPYSTFRFDFRGNGESGGEPGYANMTEDTEDIHTVASHFEKQGYQIFAVIGHSRGSVAGLKYATTCERPLDHFVNIAGRYKMNDNQIYRNRPQIGEALDRQGYFDWAVKQRDRIVQIKVTREDVDRFTSWDNSHVTRMPKSTCVLTCHGTNDNIVPAYNAAMYANKIPTHTLALIQDADHNFKGHFDELVSTVKEYFAKHESDAYEKQMSMGQHVGLCIPRWIDVEGVKNFRDIGGWPVKDGSGYIRERVVFRCGHLTDITDQGIRTLQELNVVAIFDFRSDMEINYHGGIREIPGTTYYESAIFKDVDFSPENMGQTMGRFLEGTEGFILVYLTMLEKAKDQYRKILLHMIEHHSRDTRDALIIHCTAGKDRTGLFCMMLLGLCGVDDEIIAREYALTNLGFWESEEDMRRKANRAGVPLEHMKAAMSAPYEAMKGTLKKVEEIYGSMEGYVQKTCGLTSEQCQAIRDIMVLSIRFEERQLFRPKI